MTSLSISVCCTVFIFQWTSSTSESGEVAALSIFPQGKTTLCWAEPPVCFSDNQSQFNRFADMKGHERWESFQAGWWHFERWWPRFPPPKKLKHGETDSNERYLLTLKVNVFSCTSFTTRWCYFSKMSHGVGPQKLISDCHLLAKREDCLLLNTIVLCSCMYTHWV